MDTQKKHGKSLFGGGFLLSKKATAEKIIAEKIIAEKNKKVIWELSSKELKLIEKLF